MGIIHPNQHFCKICRVPLQGNCILSKQAGEDLEQVALRRLALMPILAVFSCFSRLVAICRKIAKF